MQGPALTWVCKIPSRRGVQLCRPAVTKIFPGCSVRGFLENLAYTLKTCPARRLRKWRTTLSCDPSNLETGAPHARPTDGYHQRNGGSSPGDSGQDDGGTKSVPTTRSWRSGWEAVLCGDETDMADDTREAEQDWFQGLPWNSR